MLLKLTGQLVKLSKLSLGTRFTARALPGAMAARRISAANGRTWTDERRRKCMGGSWRLEDRSAPKHNRPSSAAVAIATTRIASVMVMIGVNRHAQPKKR